MPEYPLWNQLPGDYTYVTTFDLTGLDENTAATARILIEDDGIGINKQVYGSPGEHIGLSIMRERASRLGGKLQVESEPGEGTRIVLELNQPASANNLT